MRRAKFTIILITFLSFAALPALAQYKLETALPGISEIPAGTELPSYINYLFVFGLGTIGILSLMVMMYGGIQYILAAGNVAKTTDAKEWIWAALTGMGLLLVSYLLLRTINPDLVSLRNPSLRLKQFQFETPKFITGDEAKNATYSDILKAPDNTTYIVGGSTITKTKDAVVDCDAFGVCTTHKISDFEKYQKK